MPHFPKPAAGSWTQAYPELGTEPVDYSDSFDPAHFADEQEAIFKRTWLNVGRIERLPKVGSYFTRELPSVCKGTSIIVVKGKDGVVRAFHNICRHRGNKLVWNDFPNEETEGTCRQFTCKYHAWRYSLDGDLTFIQQEGEFFDVDKSQYGLVPVRCEVWEGFIFVNFDDNAGPLNEYLGPLAKGIEGYPFGEMTEVYSYKSDIGSNWKLFLDAFVEFYHAPILHQGQYTKEEAAKIQKFGYEALHYELAGPHSLQSTWGGQSPPADLNMVKPLDRALRSGLFGPWDKPDVIADLKELPPSVNIKRVPQWGIDSFVFFPNFMILIWEPGWYLTYQYWPTAADKHTFEASLYFVPPRNARERLAQELAAVTFKEYALQDANTLEATQTMIGTKVVDGFLLCDQEVLIRHLHKTARDYVSEYKKEHANGATV
ncbi:(2Fe-2S)-binding protein [Mycolicibacter kumamotonensis]|uniref:(2Fe-2S)-binding protein n=2 Tax=Mycolicibacter kumamotonensis TaxID=354243 RepID=A0A1X0E756_9MYCO|nr:aromatic ring-hydroxylating dioxygenase subunit alpha [Mycolicibacter kumamotonensis]ORA80544.1 (2Fe-2S)-binding protein [Mycolicibacter kumamotonensis]